MKKLPPPNDNEALKITLATAAHAALLSNPQCAALHPVERADAPEAYAQLAVAHADALMQHLTRPAGTVTPPRAADTPA